MPSTNTYEYGCLMLQFGIDPKEWGKFTTSMIKPDDLYTEEEGYGVEDEPYCTLLCGFIHDKFNLLDAVPLLKKLDKIKVSSRKIDIFKNPKYDVLKFNLDGKDLHDINALLTKNFDYHNDYPDYHPHATIAYLKPGMGDKYVRDLSKPYIFPVSQYKYSAPTGEKTYFTI